MGNPTLEALQRKSYKKDLKIAEYSFTCNQEGVICPESPKINIEGEGIRLHFFRYGLLDRATPVQDETEIEVDNAVIAREEDAEILLLNRRTGDVIVYDTNTKEQKTTVELDEVVLKKEKFKEYGIPELKNFNITRTALTAGYIYLINDEDPNEYYELAVDQYGMLSHILWEYSKDKETGEYLDVRKQQSEKISYKIVEKGKKLRVAFSPVQWSRDYFNELNANDDKKKALMMLIDCNGFPKNHQAEETADILPFNQVKATFPNQHPSARILQDNLNDIFITEREQDEKGVNDILEDMFISFHDPTAAADEICSGIDKQVNYLKAIMASLQTGKPANELFLLMQKGEVLPEDTSEKANQITYLHRLAQLSYDFVYNNEDNVKKYDADLIEGTFSNIALDLTVGGLVRPFAERHGVEKAKLEKILGVDERAAQRAIINSYRDDLGNLMKSDYYQDAIEYYESGIADNIEDAKGLSAEHIIALGHYPNMYDRHLDLQSVYKFKEDKWYKPIQDTLYNSEPEHFKKTTKILDFKISLAGVVVLDLAKKTTSNMRKIVKAYAGHSDFEGGKAARAIHGKVSYFRTDRVVTFTFRALDDFDNYLLDNKKQLTLELGEGKEAAKVSLIKFKNKWHLEYKKMTAQAAQDFIDEGKVVLNTQNTPKRFENQFKKFIQSGALAGVILVIEAYFWSEAFHKWNKERSGSNFYPLLGASVKLGAAVARIAEDTKAYEKLLAEETARITKNIGKGLGVLSSGISLVSLSKKSLTSFTNRDDDAALVYGVATGLTGVFLAADISGAAVVFFGSGAGFLAIGFWPAVLLGGGIALTLYIVEKYLKDTELQAYFTNFPLSDYTLLPNEGELSYEYVNRLVNNIEEAVTGTERYQGFKDVEVAFVELAEMLTPIHTTTEVLLRKSQLDRALNKKYHTSLHYTDTYNIYADRFKIHVYSPHICRDLPDINFEAWLYPYGIANGKKEKIETAIYYEFPKTKQNISKTAPLATCIIDFGLPRYAKYENRDMALGGIGYEYMNAEILCAIRFVEDESICEYNPKALKGNNRYKFVHFNVKQTFNAPIGNTSIFDTTTHYAKQEQPKSIKPKEYTNEQAAHKRSVFQINKLNTITTYTPENG